MEASTKQMQNNLKNLEKEKQKAQIEEDDLGRQYEALRKKNDQLEAKLAREQVQYFFKKSGVRLSRVRSVLFISGRPVSLTLNILNKFKYYQKISQTIKNLVKKALIFYNLKIFESSKIGNFGSWGVLKYLYAKSGFPGC